MGMQGVVLGRESSTHTKGVGHQDVMNTLIAVGADKKDEVKSWVNSHTAAAFSRLPNLVDTSTRRCDGRWPMADGRWPKKEKAVTGFTPLGRPDLRAVTVSSLQSSRTIRARQYSMVYGWLAAARRPRPGSMPRKIQLCERAQILNVIDSALFLHDFMKSGLGGHFEISEQHHHPPSNRQNHESSRRRAAPATARPHALPRRRTPVG
eukprot:6618615-Prymnesium_polylepis.1